MIAALALAVRVALAGVPEDIMLAADTDQPLELRQAAFARLKEDSATSTLVKTASDKDSTPARRWVAVRALGGIPSMAARDALVGLLSSENAPTRIAACLALGDRGDRSLSGRVAAKLDDKALLVRQAAADALGTLGDPATIPDLERALKDPSNEYRGTSLWVRRHFVEAMGKIGTDRAIAPLASALDDNDADVQQAAIGGLEAIAKFSYASGRSKDEEKEAWRRWAAGR